MSEYKKYLTTRRITLIGILTALILVLNAANIGIINLRLIGLPVDVTILHIPVIIGAIIEGPLVGAILGLFFGISSFFNAIYRPTPTSFVFLNPLVSILPRIIIGIATYYTYRIVKFKYASLRAGIATAIGTLTNTILVLFSIYIIYAQQFMKELKLPEGDAVIFLVGIAVTNGIPELIFSILVCIPIILKLNSNRNKSKIV